MESVSRFGATDLAVTMATYGQALRLHQEALNALNVYPVPDGDTGTNMALTLESVVAALAGLEGLEHLGPPPSPSPPARQPAPAGATSMAEVCKAIAHGSLMGARGNSGVILSQLLRGLTGVLAEGGDEADGAVLARGLAAASDAARQAVLRPVEGTILTVARAAAEGAGQAALDGAALLAVIEASRRAAADALAHTPEQLPVLAQAGVVDAGGSGYLLFLDAALTVIDGRPLPAAPAVTAPAYSAAAASFPHAGSGAEGPGGRDDLRYEVMYFLEAPDHTMGAFKEVWAGLGDSIVVVGGDGLWNCHIHTNDVGASIEAAFDAGRPRNIRVTDLADQVEEERWVREGAGAPGSVAAETGPPPRTAVVAVANGEGIGRIFRSLGVHHLVAGGQSMNPSTAQILEVVDSVPSAEVVLLPNNDNIHPVAMQVCELATKTVRVVPTSGIVEGFAALLEYDPEAGATDNAASMAESARRVVAGEVTKAVRDATGPAGPIHAGDWMGLSRDGVEVVGDSIAEATCGLLGKLLRDDHELVTLIEGDGAGAGETRRVTEWLAEHRPDVAVEVHHGGQPLYPYLISIE
ncbi:MAG TPA: DAK2 domain-containing protein [Acidimicrobiales bacterium]|nr:DAK2 domain-containing protein [Acidimicrobiales bacterium]